MTKALVMMAKAFAAMIDAHYLSFDRETGALMLALAEWVSKNEKTAQ